MRKSGVEGAAFKVLSYQIADVGAPDRSFVRYRFIVLSHCRMALEGSGDSPPTTNRNKAPVRSWPQGVTKDRPRKVAQQQVPGL